MNAVWIRGDRLRACLAVLALFALFARTIAPACAHPLATPDVTIETLTGTPLCAHESGAPAPQPPSHPDEDGAWCCVVGCVSAELATPLDTSSTIAFVPPEAERVRMPSAAHWPTYPARPLGQHTPRGPPNLI